MHKHRFAPVRNKATPSTLLLRLIQRVRGWWFSGVVDWFKRTFSRNHAVQQHQSQFAIETLEPRVLLSADLMPYQGAVVRFIDPAPDTTSSQPNTNVDSNVAGFAPAITGGTDRTVNIVAYSWNSHTLLDSVSVDLNGRTGNTDINGNTTITSVTGANVSVGANRVVSSDNPAEIVATESAVDLQDAIAVLKLIVGLDVNTPGQSLSPFQALSADFDGNGQVQLSDAIGILKHVVGLPNAEPTWRFVSEADASVALRASTNPGAPVASSALDLSAAGASVSVGLVGYLSGDVNGSYRGAPGALDLDTARPGYFAQLAFTPDMTQASDTGVSNSDNVTENTTPTFTVSYLPPGYVSARLVVDGSEVGATISLSNAGVVSM
ncbi:MAG: LEPR-XLL domain-containing protein, partial [Rhodoferax sp.]|nr:LEPR-XLL domain-containing protein [Rhodoferax sp.]